MIFAQGPFTVMWCCCYLCQRQCGSERNYIKYSKVPWRPELTTMLLWTCNCKYYYCNFFQNCQGSLWFMMMAYGNAGSARLITAASNRNLPGGHPRRRRRRKLTVCRVCEMPPPTNTQSQKISKNVSLCCCKDNFSQERNLHKTQKRFFQANRAMT